MRTRGMTLMEVLVAMALLGILMTVAHSLLTGALGTWGRAMRTVDQQNAIIQALSRLTGQLELSDAQSLALLDSNHTLPLDGSPTHAASFLAPAPNNPLDLDGFSVWGQFQVWYLGAEPGSADTHQALYLQVVSLTKADSHPTPYRLTTFTPARDVVVLRNVAAFDIGAPTRGSVVSGGQRWWMNPVALHLATQDGNHPIDRRTSVMMHQNLDLQPALAIPPP